MPYRSFSLVILTIILGSYSISAQKFWLLTYEFPGGPKTGISGSNDTCLFVGLQYGVMRSLHEGNTWETVLQSGPVFTVHASPSGYILAGGLGTIYRSTDFGNHWDSVSLQHSYPVTRFVTKPTGEAWAITGEFSNELGYVGAGVYYAPAPDAGWSARNNGLGNYLSCNQIALDHNGRLYLTASDEYVTGQGGLFLSDNGGLSWQHIPIRIDGDGVIEDDIRVEYVTGLSVLNNDSLYLSVIGSAGSAAVRMNLRKHLQDIEQPDFWQPYLVLNTPSWWYERALYGIHQAHNGDRYSSVTGTMTSGGTYFSKYQSHDWNNQQQGLGLDMTGQYNVQEFYENSKGIVYMVQRYDERIYRTDTSALVSSIPVIQPPTGLQVTAYPNPVQSGQQISITAGDRTTEKNAFLHDAQGKLIHRQVLRETAAFQMPTEPGVYFLVVGDGPKRAVLKLVVIP